MESETKGPNKRNQILGGTLGAIAGLIVVGLIFFVCTLRRRRRAQLAEEKEFEKSSQSPESPVGNSPVNTTTSAPFSTGTSSKAREMMLYNAGGPSAVSPSSDSDSPVGEASLPSGSSQQQQQQQTRLVPQRTHLHVTNLVPGDGKSLPSPMTPPGLQPERGQTQEQDQNLRREVEQLRMEMDAIRAGQQVHTEEPPPRYDNAN